MMTGLRVPISRQERDWTIIQFLSLLPFREPKLIINTDRSDPTEHTRQLLQARFSMWEKRSTHFVSFNQQESTKLGIYTQPFLYHWGTLKRYPVPRWSHFDAPMAHFRLDSDCAHAGIDPLECQDSFVLGYLMPISDSIHDFFSVSRSCSIVFRSLFHS